MKAAQRVLPESRFELQHAGSPPEEAALEDEDNEKQDLFYFFEKRPLVVYMMASFANELTGPET